MTMVRRFGEMDVIGSDQFRGRLYACKCGAQNWTAWGRAARHAETCSQAQERMTMDEVEAAYRKLRGESSSRLRLVR